MTWDDIDNKAEYETSGKGISYSTGAVPLNAQGLLSDMIPSVKDDDRSTTKTAVAEGEITIKEKTNQRQDIEKLNRDTEHSLSRLQEIFDKAKTEEKQELIHMMNMVGNKVIHEAAEHYNWKDGSEEKMLLHGALGALTGKMSGGNALAGALSGSINEYAVGYIEKTKGKEWMAKHPDAVQAISTALGGIVGSVAGDGSTGAYTAQMGTKWNYLDEEIEAAEEKSSNFYEKYKYKDDKGDIHIISIQEILEHIPPDVKDGLSNDIAKGVAEDGTLRAINWLSKYTKSNYPELERIAPGSFGGIKFLNRVKNVTGYVAWISLYFEVATHNKSEKINEVERGEAYE